MTKLVIVKDNATFQVDLEKVIKEDEFNATTIIRSTDTTSTKSSHGMLGRCEGYYELMDGRKIWIHLHY